MERPFISICIPSYNRPKQIHELLLSIVSHPKCDPKIMSKERQNDKIEVRFRIITNRSVPVSILKEFLNDDDQIIKDVASFLYLYRSNKKKWSKLLNLNEKNILPLFRHLSDFLDE